MKTILFTALAAFAGYAYAGDSPDQGSEKDGDAPAIGSVYKCQAFVARGHGPRSTNGFFTPWEYGETEDEARDEALEACTSYGTGCSISSCQEVARPLVEEQATHSCLAVGSQHMGHHGNPGHMIYQRGYGTDAETAATDATNACRTFATGCQVVSCKAL